MISQRNAYRFLLLCASFWCALIVLPALLHAAWPGSSGAIIYDLFSRVCHQWDSHSLHLFGVKLAVCARCFAIYAGFLAGAICAPGVYTSAVRRSRTVWLCAAAPMLLDVLLDMTSWYAATEPSRLATGSLFGITAGALLILPLAEACSALLASFRSLSLFKKSA